MVFFHGSSNFLFFPRYERSNIYEEARSGHVTCNMWGWVCLYGAGELNHIEGRFTAAKYLEILEECFLPSLRDSPYSFEDRLIFVHDNCPIHRAGIINRWFEDHPTLELLNWPSKGCDMNPIENVWANMVNSWEPQQERTRENLVNHTKLQWEMFRNNPELVYNIVSNMSERLQAVIDKEGGWSGY